MRINPNPPPQRGLRIGNVSGATGDAPHAMLRMASTGAIDFITGDWLSEMNIAWNAIAKAEDPSLGYEGGFLDQLEESIDVIVQKKIKVVTNAGALNTEALRDRVRDMCVRKGYGKLKIAAVLGDDVTGQVVEWVKRRPEDRGDAFGHLDHAGQGLADWAGKYEEPASAVAYIGAWGIVEALKGGADIVLCGRVTDASPVVCMTWIFDYLLSTCLGILLIWLNLDRCSSMVAWMEPGFV
jgi:hypothetical protein